MGSHITFHSGPYIKIKSKKIVRQKIIRGCDKSGCRNHNKNISDTTINFCASCGTVIHNIEIEQNTNYGWYGFADDFDRIDFFQHLSGDDNGWEYIVENENRPAKSPAKIKLDDDGRMQDIEGDKINEEMIWFKNHFSDFIAQLKEIFGEDNVIVGYGVSSYYN